MTEEILKLAKECGAWTTAPESYCELVFGRSEVEAFYRAAYNKAVRDVVATWNGGITLEDIRSLKIKP